MKTDQAMTGPKLWVAGDLNGFFGLCTNSITNTVSYTHLTLPTIYSV